MILSGRDCGAKGIVCISVTTNIQSNNWTCNSLWENQNTSKENFAATEVYSSYNREQLPLVVWTIVWKCGWLLYHVYTALNCRIILLSVHNLLLIHTFWPLSAKIWGSLLIIRSLSLEGPIHQHSFASKSFHSKQLSVSI